MATIDAKEGATVVSLVLAAVGPELSEVGFLTWGALIGGMMAIAMTKEPIGILRSAWYVFLGMAGAIALGVPASQALPNFQWFKDAGLTAPFLWMPVGLAIGAFWRQAWVLAEKYIARGKQ